MDDDNSEHIDNGDYTEQDDDKLSDDDPQIDFTALAINYHTIDTIRTLHHTLVTTRAHVSHVLESKVSSCIV